MPNCSHCEGRPNGCPGLRLIRIVADHEISNPAFIRDLRCFLAILRVPRQHMLDYLADILRDAECVAIANDNGEMDIDLQALEVDSIEWWLKDFCKAPPTGLRCRVKKVARERVRTLATIMRIKFPREAALWGQAANDNTLMAANDNGV